MKKNNFNDYGISEFVLGELKEYEHLVRFNTGVDDYGYKYIHIKFHSYLHPRIYLKKLATNILREFIGVVKSSYDMNGDSIVVKFKPVEELRKLKIKKLLNE